MSLLKTYPSTLFDPITAVQTNVAGHTVWLTPSNILTDDALATISLTQNQSSAFLELKYALEVDSGKSYGNKSDIYGFSLEGDFGGSHAGGVHNVVIMAKVNGQGYVPVSSGQLSAAGIGATVGTIEFGNATNIRDFVLSADYESLSAGSTITVLLSAVNSAATALTLSANNLKVKVDQIGYVGDRPNYKNNQLHWLGF